MIELPCGAVALVDRADQELVAGFRWKLHSNGYVYADRGHLRVALHRLVAGAGERDVADHVNGDPLDNRTCNLRLATRGQNGANAGPNRLKSGKTSQYKGVSWATAKNKWLANIHVNGRTRYLGRFDDEKEAARVYNRAAVEAWGEFARLNDV
jgi:hypothetical protein